MAVGKKVKFDLEKYLQATGIVRKVLRVKAKHTLFTQGDSANSVFYLESGHAKLIVISARGKEATVSLMKAGDFIGEDTLAAAGGIRSAAAITLTPSVLLKLDREQMIQLLHDEPEFADVFLRFVITRAVKTQEDLIDQLFNNSEKRLARTLLLMAEFGSSGEPEEMIPVITQEALAEMIGTTRSRVSFFMNRFRKRGYIDYNGRIHIHKSLLNVVLHDKLPKQEASRPVTLEPQPRAEKKPAKIA